MDVLLTSVDDGNVVPAMHPQWFFRLFDEWDWWDRELLPLADQGPVLDLGAGAGRASLYFQSRGFDVTAVDFSDLAIEKAKRQAGEAGARVNFMTADVLDPPDLGGPYRFIFDRGCYHVVRRLDVQAYLRTLQSITEPGAFALVLAGNAKEPHDPGPPVVTEEEIRAELGTLFAILWLRDFSFDQVEAVGVQFLGWSCGLRRRAGAATMQPS